jgi:LVIVD repeat
MMATKPRLAMALGFALIQIVLARANNSIYVQSRNMLPIGQSERLAPLTETGAAVFNSDLTFWGDRAYQGTYEGFRIIDISSPANPHVIVDFTDCVQGTRIGAQGDVAVYGTILVRSWNDPAPSGGATCGGILTPGGLEGIHIFDISNPAAPVGVLFVPTKCGSHTAMAVPDSLNGRLLVYSSPSADECPWIDIIEIPLTNLSAASLINEVATGRRCHDGGVILGTSMLAACAGGDGFSVLTLDPAKGGSLQAPLLLYSHSIAGVSVGHSAAFSWDGQVLIFGHEPGGGAEANCQSTSDIIARSLFFFDAATGGQLGTFVLPRPQTEAENCTWHYYNAIPTDRRRILVSGNYQSGISVIDFTNPASAKEVAYADPLPLEVVSAEQSDIHILHEDQGDIVVGGDWSAYWYNGFIYESDMRHGLTVWRLNDAVVAGAHRLSHLNPQTQEFNLDGPRMPRN